MEAFKYNLYVFLFACIGLGTANFKLQTILIISVLWLIYFTVQYGIKGFEMFFTLLATRYMALAILPCAIGYLLYLFVCVYMSNNIFTGKKKEN